MRDIHFLADNNQHQSHQKHAQLEPGAMDHPAYT